MCTRFRAGFLYDTSQSWASSRDGYDVSRYIIHHGFSRVHIYIILRSRMYVREKKMKRTGGKHQNKKIKSKSNLKDSRQRTIPRKPSLRPRQG